MLCWLVAGPPPTAAESSSHRLEFELCCPARAAPASLEQLSEATRRGAEVACFGDDRRLATARRLEWLNHCWCLAWRLQPLLV